MNTDFGCKMNFFLDALLVLQVHESHWRKNRVEYMNVGVHQSHIDFDEIPA